MRRFAALVAALDASRGSEARLAALQRYLAEAEPADAARGLHWLAGAAPRPSVPGALLRAQAAAAAGLPDWLFEISLQATGDLAETIALVLPPPGRPSALGLAAWWVERLQPLRGAGSEQQAQCLRSWWDELAADERWLLVKLIGGGFRPGVSALLLQRAVARHAGLDASLVAQRWAGWADARQPPSAERLQALMAPESAATPATGRPYPFSQPRALAVGEGDPGAGLGAPGAWQVEWQFDGLRAQIVRRAGAVWIWSQADELVTGRFPEVAAQAAALPDGCVLAGTLLAWSGDAPAPFTRLQQRIARQTVSRKLLAELPVQFIASDLLELDGQDRRALPLQQRRARLEALLAATALRLSPRLQAASWGELAALRAQGRAHGATGLVLRQSDAACGSTGDEADGAGWIWQSDPLTLAAVLVYAQAGSGRRAGQPGECGFAVWSRPPADAAEAAAVLAAIDRREPAQPGALQLLTVAKAAQGLGAAETLAVDAEIRAHTLQKFGPVRSLRPRLVFELGFDGIARSARHKSGVVLRSPRILRLLPGRAPQQADALAALHRLL